MANHNVVKIGIGSVFGSLTVESLSTEKMRGARFWLCRCVCGKLKGVAGSHLRAGCVNSCGCQRYVRKHNMSHSPAWAVWCGMISRCTNPKDKRWEDYGGRGIAVCDAWKDFEAFYADMGSPPKGLQLDRQDNEKGYSKENCRWVTPSENCRNTRRALYVEYAGQRLHLLEAAKLSGIAYHTLQRRLAAGGREDLFRPVPEKIVRTVYQGKEMPLHEAAQLSGIPYKELRRRMTRSAADIFRPFKPRK